MRDTGIGPVSLAWSRNKILLGYATSENRTRIRCLGSNYSAIKLWSQNFTGFSKIIVATLFDFRKKLAFSKNRFNKLPNFLEKTQRNICWQIIIFYSLINNHYDFFSRFLNHKFIANFFFGSCFCLHSVY